MSTVAVTRELAKRQKTHQSAVPLLLMQIKALQLPEPIVELKFHPSRAWRFDVAFLGAKVAVEVDGGVFTGGRHARGAGIEGDHEKVNEGILRGWTIYRVTPRHVKNGKAAA